MFISDNYDLKTLLPEQVTPLGYVIAVKALDEDGHLVLYCGRSVDITPWEALGMAETVAGDARSSLREDT